MARFVLASGGELSFLVVNHVLGTSGHLTGRFGFIARVLGESGRYASQEAVRKRHAIWTRVMLFAGLAGAIWGFMVRGLFPGPRISSWAFGVTTVALALLIWGASKWTLRKVKELDKERVNWQRGAEGEDLVARELERFPEEFKVINDLTSPFGNLDHVVVGPTGVFLPDTKNWRGVVSADGHGELLCSMVDPRAVHLGNIGNDPPS